MVCLNLEILKIVIPLIGFIILIYQIYKKSNSESAIFTTNYIEKNLEKYQDIIRWIRSAPSKDITKVKSPDSHKLEGFMDFLENIAVFEKNGIIKKKHIELTLGYILRKINTKNDIQKFITTYQKEDNKLYTAIEQFLKKFN